MSVELLTTLAAKYIWWKSPEEALVFPERIMAQVMELGDYDDMQQMVETIGEETLREVLRHADAGLFSARSWTYWHYRLGLAELGQVPPLPARKVA